MVIRPGGDPGRGAGLPRRARARRGSPTRPAVCSCSTGTSRSSTSEGENASPSPYYFELQLDPVAWADLGDRDVEQAVVHSHVSSPPRPSRTDVERIGFWQGRPYVIYSVRLDELAAWRIVDGAIEPVPLSR